MAESPKIMKFFIFEALWLLNHGLEGPERCANAQCSNSLLCYRCEKGLLRSVLVIRLFGFFVFQCAILFVSFFDAPFLFLTLFHFCVFDLLLDFGVLAMLLFAC